MLLLLCYLGLAAAAGPEVLPLDLYVIRVLLTYEGAYGVVEVGEGVRIRGKGWE